MTSEENILEDLNEDEGPEKGSLPSEENNERAKEHIKSVVRSYQQNFFKNLGARYAYSQDQSSNDDINVELKDGIAYIQCRYCDFKSKAYCETDRKRQKMKWVLSNVNRHFKTHFKDSVTSNKKMEQRGKANSRITTYFPSVKDLPLAGQSSYARDSYQVNSEVNSETQFSLTDLTTSEEVDEQGFLTQNDLDQDSIQDLIYDEITIGDTELDTHCKKYDSRGDSVILSPFENIVENKNPSRSRVEKNISSRKLELDLCQSKITDFYEICEKIKCHIVEHPLIHEAFKTSANIFCDARDVEFYSSEKRPSSFFEMIITTVTKNSSGSSSSNRFPDELKRLCLYLYLTSGRLAYETLVANIPHGLPSISALSRSLSENYEKFAEGELAFCKLKEYLDKRKYPLRIFISEDQTAIVRRPRYDQSTNQLVGYVLSNSEYTGFPKGNQNMINSVSDVKKIIENEDLAKNAYVYMAQPLADAAGAFCLTIFGSSNSFTTDDVLRRWEHIKNEANRHDIVVEGFSSDGDSRCLKAMRIISGLPSFSDQESPYSPYFKANFSTNNPVPIQDTVHISTKIKNRLLNPKIVLKMGCYEVSKDHLVDLINNVSKDKHFLCLSFLDNTDKMNFDAIDRLSSSCVTDLLMANDRAKATRQVLILTRCILDSYLDKSLCIKERVYLIWYAAFFLRLWRAWIKEQSNYTLTKNCLTLNTYTCIELNAHGLLIFIEKFKTNPELVLPWLYSSQPCEKFFRQTRSMTSTWSTVVNFDMLDLLRRRHRIQAIYSIISDSGEKFVFPREKNKRLGSNVKIREETVPTPEEINNILLKARDGAIKDCKSLGMNLDQWERALSEVSIPKLDTVDYEEHKEEHTEECNLIPKIAESRNELDVLEVNEEDAQDVNQDRDVWKDLKVLNIKDFSGNKSESDRSVLRITINEKEMVVKKSTLCWLFFKRKGRLSSDRLLRFKSMEKNGVSNIKARNRKSPRKLRKKTEEIPKEKIQNTKKKTWKKINESDSETSVSDSYSVQSEFEAESFSENDSLSDQNSEQNSRQNLNKISIIQEAYYAVCYRSWYIGRVVNLIDKERSEIKFLKLELDKYVWPREEDKQIVNNKFIFYGPISLLGNGPFDLKRDEKAEIEKLYKNVKKNLKDFL